MMTRISPRLPAAATRRTMLGGLGGLLALSACELPGGGDPPRLYTLSPKSTFDPDLPKVPWQLTVETPIAEASLDTTRIAVQRTPVTVDYYARSAWTDRAPALVQTLLIQSFENTGKIVAVGRESVGLRADYTLKLELRQFEALQPASTPPDVRVRLNAKLVRTETRAIIADFTAENIVKAESGEMQAIVLTFDDALGKTLRRIVEWTLRAPAAAEPQRPGGRRMG